MRIRLHEPTWEPDGPEVQAALAVLNSTYVTAGDKVREFEAQFGPNAVMVNSGSSANLLAIAAICNPMCDGGLRPGDEVIVSALSWATTVWPLVQHGLVPKIVDIDPETLNIDLDQVREANGPRTRALMPVAVYGNPVPKWQADLVRIDDCCEALGAEPGPVSDIATYSFYFSHHITSLEGGMVVSQSWRTAELFRVLRAHGWIRDIEYNKESYIDKNRDIDPKFLFVNAGYNLRPTEVAAAIGLVQLPKLPLFVEARRRAAAMLKDVFKPYSHFLRTQKETPGGKSSWFGFPIIVSNAAPFKAKALRTHFERHDIETRAIICGNIARQPGMKLWPHEVVGDLKHADHVMRNGFSIGCHQNVGEAEVAYVAQVLEDFMRKVA